MKHFHVIAKSSRRINEMGLGANLRLCFGSTGIIDEDGRSIRLHLGLHLLILWFSIHLFFDL